MRIAHLISRLGAFSLHCPRKLTKRQLFTVNCAWKGRHATPARGVFVSSTHSDTQAVPTLRCIRMFKGILSIRAPTRSLTMLQDSEASDSPLQRAHVSDFKTRDFTHPEGSARHLDVSRQKLSLHCLKTVFDSQSPSPELSPKMPSKLSLAHKRGLVLPLSK